MEHRDSDRREDPPSRFGLNRPDPERVRGKDSQQGVCAQRPAGVPDSVTKSSHRETRVLSRQYLGATHRPNHPMDARSGYTLAAQTSLVGARGFEPLTSSASRTAEPTP